MKEIKLHYMYPLDCNKNYQWTYLTFDHNLDNFHRGMGWISERSTGCLFEEHCRHTSNPEDRSTFPISLDSSNPRCSKHRGKILDIGLKIIGQFLFNTTKLYEENSKSRNNLSTTFVLQKFLSRMRTWVRKLLYKLLIQNFKPWHGNWWMLGKNKMSWMSDRVQTISRGSGRIDWSPKCN
jgi:hypothetical protein